LRLGELHLAETSTHDQDLGHAADFGANILPGPALLAFDIEELFGETGAGHGASSLQLDGLDPRGEARYEDVKSVGSKLYARNGGGALPLSFADGSGFRSGSINPLKILKSPHIEEASSPSMLGGRGIKNDEAVSKCEGADKPA
jgi:hypothetical protein